MRAEINEESLEGLGSGGLISDGTIPGFMARKLDSGLITFALKYPAPESGRQRWMTLGNSREITLHEARKRATKERARVEAGTDPQHDRDIERSVSRSIKVNEMLDQFLVKYVETRQLRSAKQIAWCFGKYVRPTLGKMAVRELRRGDVVKMLDTIAENHGPVISDRVLAHFRKACCWYAIRDEKFNVPIVRGMARSSPRARARERILTDGEIRALWNLTADSVHQEFNTIVRVLLLTGQRRSEVANMRWCDIRGDSWTIPSQFSKNGVSHVVHLTASVLALLSSILRKEGPYLFGKTGQTGYGGFSKSKSRLECEMAAIMKDEVPIWTLHDLRRTACSLMARGGVRAEVSERVLNHSAPGVRHIYDRYNYSEEKKNALEILSAQVSQIASRLDQ
ncbi:MAG: tyrosine-type recombinase/integrase [Proteobacteria bacterium]|nr:tyrosine-type recombinase/integrase [Pseudomonadota bacterium]